MPASGRHVPPNRPCTGLSVLCRQMCGSALCCLCNPGFVTCQKTSKAIHFLAGTQCFFPEYLCQRLFCSTPPNPCSVKALSDLNLSFSAQGGTFLEKVHPDRNLDGIRDRAVFPCHLDLQKLLVYCEERSMRPPCEGGGPIRFGPSYGMFSIQKDVLYEEW